MKLFNKIVLALAVLVAFTSCEDFVGGDINANPNKPVTVPVGAQLPAIELAVCDLYGGSFSTFSTMLAQQVEGVARQWSSFNRYTGLTPNRFDGMWQNVYENILIECKTARASAAEAGLNHYGGIVDILEGFTLIAASDLWDDMPYTEALQGIANTSPTYDTQASIYEKALGFLDSGVAALEGPVGAAAPGNDDLFFGGDAAGWVKAAKAVKARALLHQGDYAQAMALASSLESASDNWDFQYPDANNSGPWFGFNRDRTGDLEFNDKTMGPLMRSLNDDARLALFNQTFNGANTYLVADWLQDLVSYREMQFIIAECAFRAGDSATAHAAYLRAVEASFARVGESDAYADYVAQASVDPGADALTLEHIITQKYIGLFLDMEVYNDWRRTGIPTLTPVSGTQVPVRFEYPSTEYLFNANSPSEGSVSIYTDRVGWNR